MKNKKIYIAIILSLFVGCTNLRENNIFNEISNMVGSNDKKVDIRELLAVEEDEKNVESEEKVLTSQNVEKYLTEIKDRLKKSEKRNFSKVKNYYQGLIGEQLILPLENENFAKLTTAPKNTLPKVSIKDNSLYFRSIYKGEYYISTYKGNTLERKIKIEILPKYSFTEKNIFDIILENSEKNNKILEDAITLYKIHYPEGKNYKKVNYYLLKYGYLNNDSGIMNEALESFKDNITNFSDEEQAYIINAASKLNKNLYIPANVYSTSNKNLIDALNGYLLKKDILDKKDALFMEKSLKEGFIKDANQVKNKLDSWYKNNGQVSNTSNIYTRINESINSFSDPRDKISALKKSLVNTKDKNKKLETYYDIANSYLKLGNKVEAFKYLNLIKQEATGGEVLRKAETLIKELK